MAEKKAAGKKARPAVASAGNQGENLPRANTTPQPKRKAMPKGTRVKK